MREGVAAARGFAVGVGMRLDLAHYLPKSAIDAPIHSPHQRPRRTTIAWVAGLGFAGLAALAALLPALMHARYRAVRAFRNALRWSADDPAMYRTRTQSYLQLGPPPQATDAPEQSYRLRLQSLLIRRALAEAYDASGQIQRGWSAGSAGPVGEPDVVAWRAAVPSEAACRDVRMVCAGGPRRTRFGRVPVRYRMCVQEDAASG
jgi:hypothetical protein